MRRNLIALAITVALPFVFAFGADAVVRFGLQDTMIGVGATICWVALFFIVRSLLP